MRFEDTRDSTNPYTSVFYNTCQTWEIAQLNKITIGKGNLFTNWMNRLEA